MPILTFKEILELIDKVADLDLSAVEIESAGMKVRIEGRGHGAGSLTPIDLRGAAAHFLSHAPSGVSAPQLSSADQSSAAGVTSAEEEVDSTLHVITSPIVGTFYRAPNPESDVFVNVGDHVSKGSVLCIIEAMKLMNEIESDVDGTVVKIFPQNGQPIEYGEKLFAVKV